MSADEIKLCHEDKERIMQVFQRNFEDFRAKLDNNGECNLLHLFSCVHVQKKCTNQILYLDFKESSYHLFISTNKNSKTHEKYLKLYHARLQALFYEKSNRGYIDKVILEMELLYDAFKKDNDENNEKKNIVRQKLAIIDFGIKMQEALLSYIIAAYKNQSPDFLTIEAAINNFDKFLDKFCKFSSAAIHSNDKEYIVNSLYAFYYQKLTIMFLDSNEEECLILSFKDLILEFSYKYDNQNEDRIDYYNYILELLDILFKLNCKNGELLDYLLLTELNIGESSKDAIPKKAEKLAAKSQSILTLFEENMLSVTLTKAISTLQPA